MQVPNNWLATLISWSVATCVYLHASFVDLKQDTWPCKDNKEVHYFLKNTVFRKHTSLLSLLNLSVCIELATCTNILSCKLGKNPD